MLLLKELIYAKGYLAGYIQNLEKGNSTYEIFCFVNVKPLIVLFARKLEKKVASKVTSKVSKGKINAKLDRYFSV